MAKLSKEERSALAKKAAKSRWLANEFSSFKRATHYGEMHLGSKMIPCAVLEDGTRVITQTGFLRAMGKAGGAKARGGQIESAVAVEVSRNLAGGRHRD